VTSAPWLRYDAAASKLTLSLYVQPNARTTAVAGLHAQDLKVRIAAPAVDNKANAAVRAFIAHALAVPAARVGIRRGVASRRKIIEIDAATPDLVTRALGLAETAQ
jgi:hypothetical protein